MKRVIFICLMIIILLTGHYEYKMNVLRKDHKQTVEEIENSYNSKIDSILKNVDELNYLYKVREEEVQSLTKKKEELEKEFGVLEDIIETKPDVVEKNIENIFDDFMDRVYKETGGK